MGLCGPTADNVDASDDMLVFQMGGEGEDPPSSDLNSSQVHRRNYYTVIIIKLGSSKYHCHACAHSLQGAGARCDCGQAPSTSTHFGDRVYQLTDGYEQDGRQMWDLLY